jgi:hypothetical protein
MNRLLCLFALFALILLVACGSSSENTGTPITPTPSTHQAQPTETPTPKPAHFKLGQTVKIGTTWTITIKSVRRVQDEVEANINYLVFNLAIRNISATEQTFSSLNFTLRDQEGQAMDIGIISGVKQSPSGKVEVGDPLSGDIVFAVHRAKQQKFLLSYEENVVTPGQVLWDVTA